MALTIEDGTIVQNANSYVTLAEVREYATQRGLTLPTADVSLEPLVVRAYDYLESLAYKGVPIEALQPSSWPRKLVYVNGTELPDDEIPLDLKKANCQLAYEANTVNLQPTTSGQKVVREKVDVIEVEYEANGVSSNSPVFKTVESLLKNLISSGGIGSTLTIRI